MNTLDPDTVGRVVAFVVIAIGLSGTAAFFATALSRRLRRKHRSAPFVIQWAKLTAVLAAAGTCAYLIGVLLGTTALPR